MSSVQKEMSDENTTNCMLLVNKKITMYCLVFYLHVATINVDSPDLTREFIWTIFGDYTQQILHTLSRLIAHKRVSSNITTKTQLQILH
jgi:hypothetical protein